MKARTTSQELSLEARSYWMTILCKHTFEKQLVIKKLRNYILNYHYFYF